MGDKLVEKFYFGLLLLLPLVYCTDTVDPILLPRQILLSIFLIAAITVLILQKKGLSLPFRTPLIYAFSAFLLFNFISIYQARVVGESHAVFAKLILLISCFLLTTALLHKNIVRQNQLVLASVLFGLLTVSFPVLTLLQKALNGGPLLRDIYLITGNSANKNLLSSILFLSLPFYFMGLRLGKIMRFLSVFGIVSTLIVLVTIRTRAVLIACLIFGLLLVCYRIKQKFAIRKRYFLGAGLGLLALLLLSYSSSLKDNLTSIQSSPNEPLKRYVSRLFDSQTFESRIHFWENSMQMLKEHPFGVGLGNWQIQFPKYGLNQFTEYGIVNGESTLQRPHNDFVWILCETGILGLVAYLAIFIVIFYQLFFLIKKANSNSEKWNFFYLCSALIGYLVIAFFDFPYERIEHQVLLMIVFAIVASAYFKMNADQIKHNKFRVVVLLMPVGYSLLVAVYRFEGEKNAMKMYVAKNQSNWSETIYLSQKSDNYFYRLDNTSMPLSWYEGIAHFNENRIEESEACFEKAYQLTPYNIQVITNLASTYQLTGKPEESIRLYSEALKISIRFDEAKLNLAALYFNQKEFDKAFSLINEIDVTSKNPKYKTYLVPILNQKINAYLKTATDKKQIDLLVKNVKTKEALLQLFFDAKKNGTDFETHLATAHF